MNGVFVPVNQRRDLSVFDVCLIHFIAPSKAGAAVLYSWQLDTLVINRQIES